MKLACIISKPELFGPRYLTDDRTWSPSLRAAKRFDDEAEAIAAAQQVELATTVLRVAVRGRGSMPTVIAIVWRKGSASSMERGV